MKAAKTEFKIAIDQFCKDAKISKGQFSDLMGLSSLSRLQEVYTRKQKYHLKHFDRIRELQRISKKTGEAFIQYMDNI